MEVVSSNTTYGDNITYILPTKVMEEGNTTHPLLPSKVMYRTLVQGIFLLCLSTVIGGVMVLFICLNIVQECKAGLLDNLIYHDFQKYKS